MIKQTKILSDEHKVILKVVEALEKRSGILSETKKINPDFFRGALDFIKNYADKFHHAKEEYILFVEFNKKSHLAHCNPVEQMLYEHTLGRECVKNMETGLRENNADLIAENGRRYAGVLKEHIMKEDAILYPMIDEVLDEKDQKLVAERAEKAEKEKFGKEFKEKYLALAEKLSQ